MLERHHSDFDRTLNIPFIEYLNLTLPFLMSILVFFGNFSFILNFGNKSSNLTISVSVLFNLVVLLLQQNIVKIFESIIETNANIINYKHS